VVEDLILHYKEILHSVFLLGGGAITFVSCLKFTYRLIVEAGYRP